MNMEEEYEQNIGYQNTIKLSGMDLDGMDLDGIDLEDDNLVDEDDLLNSYNILMSGLAIPTLDKKDCKTSRNACKNCSCGRAEESLDSESLDSESKASMCGNCYLGDGFRCDSCPSKGLPPFNPGEKL